ncbi:hypothetical protein LCGC14_0671510 [marine sediment metagenome]|uniref:Uncharacterized protein n=1 Tax=marine sediment metagenome TaxID=412755 RepID=A0A0F9RB09_9ZZZZ
MSKAKTAGEVREKFLDYVRNLTVYWEKVSNKSSFEKLQGLAFSIMVLIDGGTMMPGFDIVCRPHPDDEEYHKDQGTDWYPDGVVINKCQMHEVLWGE